MKRCFKCRDVKSLTEFYKHPRMKDGCLGKCKTCTKSDVKTRYELKIKDLDWLASERERCRIKAKTRWMLGKYSKRTSATNKRYASTHQAAIRARSKAAYAVKKGRIKKKLRCEQCGKKHNCLHKHHNKPLEVVWLCPSCHGLLHRKQYHETKRQRQSLHNPDRVTVVR